MKKLSFLLIPLFLFSFDFKQEYINNNFTRICKYGIAHINKIKNNEDTLSLVGFSCVKRDYFIYLPTIINFLKTTKKGRDNSIYFSLLFMEKKLLIGYVIDNVDISYYRFPLINHPISIVINALISKKFEKRKNVIIIHKDDMTYKVYKTKDNKVYIDVYENNKLIESHWYR